MDSPKTCRFQPRQLNGISAAAPFDASPASARRARCTTPLGSSECVDDLGRPHRRARSLHVRAPERRHPDLDVVGCKVDEIFHDDLRAERSGLRRRWSVDRAGHGRHRSAVEDIGGLRELLSQKITSRTASGAPVHMNIRSELHGCRWRFEASFVSAMVGRATLVHS
jgi:hypothetical protein